MTMLHRRCFVITDIVVRLTSILLMLWTACCTARIALAGFQANNESSRIIIDFEIDIHGIPNDDSYEIAIYNGKKLNETLHQERLRSGDTLMFPTNKTFYIMGGIVGYNLINVTIIFDSQIVFTKHIKHWPRYEKEGKVLDCISFDNLTNVTFTSSYKRNNVKHYNGQFPTSLNGKDDSGGSGAHGGGLIHGNGDVWWGIPGIGYLVRGENRPKLFVISNSRDIVFENLYLKDSPYWSFYAPNIQNLIIRYCQIDVRRDHNNVQHKHTLNDLTSFNTDGFDISGENVWIHNVAIWNQDDCIAVKGNSHNMLFENITASGLGLTIGSINHDEKVKNITFRNIIMPQTIKGIYIKYGQHVNSKKASISNILYENVTIIPQPTEQDGPTAIWIGPAQQSDDPYHPCASHPCSLCWRPPIIATDGSSSSEEEATAPVVAPSSDFNTLNKFQCNTPAAPIHNVTLRNISIIVHNNHIKNNNERKRNGIVGVIIGNATMPIRDITFDNVNVNNDKNGKLVALPVGNSGHHYNYYCPNSGVMSGVATGTTNPVPNCFQDFTTTTTRTTTTLTFHEVHDQILEAS